MLPHWYNRLLRRFPSNNQTVILLGLVALFLAIPFTVTLSQQEQDIRQSAFHRFTPSISGYVFVDANMNGERDEGERGYEGANVKIQSRASTLVVTTDVHGYFRYAIITIRRVHRASTTTYHVELTVPNNYSATTPTSASFTIPPSAMVEFGIAPSDIQPTPTDIQPMPTCRPRPTCLDAEPRCLVPEPAEGWCPGAPTPTPQYCLQVVTPARNKNTGECRVFPNSCLPDGWYPDRSCSVTPTPPTTYTQSSYPSVCQSPYCKVDTDCPTGYYCYYDPRILAPVNCGYCAPSSSQR